MAGVPVASLRTFSRYKTDTHAPDLIASAPSAPWIGMILNGGDGLSWSLKLPVGRSDPYYRAMGMGFRRLDHIAAIRRGGSALNNQANMLETFDTESAYNSQSGQDFLGVTPPPALHIDRFDTGHVILSWPVNAPGWNLVVRDSLVESAWAPVTNEVIDSAELNSVIRPVDTNLAFFGLEIQPPPP